jgi:1-phosphofructokinase
VVLVSAACVFEPAPLLTVTVEDRDGEPDIHLHAGGQGYWIARLMAELGADVVLCAPFGGEAGVVASQLMDGERLRMRPVAIGGTTGAYIHDRRSGEREEVANMKPSTLSRHESDELYGATLVEAMDAEVCVLAGPGIDSAVDVEVYRRLTGDLRGQGKTVIADLSGAAVDAALDGGLFLLKVSEEDMAKDERLESGADETAVVAMMRDLQKKGADAVAVTRADQGALVLCGDAGVVLVDAPRLEPVDHRGSGDSFTAGIAAALLDGKDLTTALRLGAAAGALNVTRRGLASASGEEVHRLAEHVEVHDWCES